MQPDWKLHSFINIVKHNPLNQAKHDESEGGHDESNVKMEMDQARSSG